jgi:AcrR family transcriptional regulator
MSGVANSTRIALRRQAAADEIVRAAWELSREHGLGNFSMRELGDRVGMRAQSVYSYFASKTEIFDAMFADGNRALIEHLRTDDERDGDAPDPHDDPVAAIQRGIRQFFSFCTSDPVRYQLLFQRTLPDFVPSEESYALARQAYEAGLGPLRELGVSDTDLDLVTALSTGLVAQQLSNDPGGDRWERQLDRVVHIVARELHLTNHTGSTT